MTKEVEIVTELLKIVEETNQFYIKLSRQLVEAADNLTKKLEKVQELSRQ